MATVVIGICFVCGGYFDSGVVVPPDPDETPRIVGRFYCHTHAPKDK